MRYLGPTVSRSPLILQPKLKEIRWCFNITLLIAGAFGLAAGGSPSFLTLASLLAVMGVGVGGNLPIDSAIFLGSQISPLLQSYGLIHVQISFLPPTNIS
jgi:hypothetical protein